MTTRLIIREVTMLLCDVERTIFLWSPKSSKKFVQNLLKQISQNQFDNENLKQLIKILHSQLKNSKGKKVYGYLSTEVKSTVNEIFEQLARDENIHSLYEKWCELERQKYMTYTQKEKIFPPLY